jgi:hypothetical protein
MYKKKNNLFDLKRDLVIDENYNDDLDLDFENYNDKEKIDFSNYYSDDFGKEIENNSFGKKNNQNLNNNTNFKSEKKRDFNNFNSPTKSKNCGECGEELIKIDRKDKNGYFFGCPNFKSHETKEKLTLNEIKISINSLKSEISNTKNLTFAELQKINNLIIRLSGKLEPKKGD